MKYNDIGYSVKISNYKSFDREQQGFDKIFPINVVVGKNNSGKSALIDIIDFSINCKRMDEAARVDGSKPKLIIGKRLTNSEMDVHIPHNYTYAHQKTWRQVADDYINEWMYYSMSSSGATEFANTSFDIPEDLKQNFRSLGKTPEHSFWRDKSFFRINADRDIQPESRNDAKPVVNHNGTGFTHAIRMIINKSAYDDKLMINETLLVELNKVVNPELEFTDLVIQELPDNKWEVFLDEKNIGRIPLSKMGSGVKTILLVLFYLNLVPLIENKSVKDCVFCFEELENNLHPSMQRKLFKYIIEYAKIENPVLFITTHSSLVIDLLNKVEGTQIIHIQKRDDKSIVTTLTSQKETFRILTDLGYKASDLMLANAVIWVEGPSDVIYLELLLKLYRQKLNSATEYLSYSIQSLSTSLWKYAGFTESTIDFTDNDIQNKIVNLARINHNHLLVIDGDDNYEDLAPSLWETFINGSGRNKAKLIEESLKFSDRSEDDLESNFGLAKNDLLYFWITKGTFENYLKYFINNQGKTDFMKYFDKEEERGFFEKKRVGKYSTISKVDLAYQIAGFIENNNLTFSDVCLQGSDLEKFISRLSNTIETWNS